LLSHIFFKNGVYGAKDAIYQREFLHGSEKYCSDTWRKHYWKYPLL